MIEKINVHAGWKNIESNKSLVIMYTPGEQKNKTKWLLKQFFRCIIYHEIKNRKQN